MKGFLREGFRELGRKLGRRRLRGQLAAQERDRNRALVRLGERAWAEGADLAAFGGLQEALRGLEGRSTELTGRIQDLEAEGAALEERRRGEQAQFGGQRRGVEEKKGPADVALREARERQDERARAVKRMEGRLIALANELAAIEQRLGSPAGGGSSAESAQRSTAQERREELLREQQRLVAELATAKAAIPGLAAEVDRLAQESKRYAAEIEKIEAERRGTLSRTDAALAQVRRELSAFGQKATALEQERIDRFRQIGLALYESRAGDPRLQEAIQEISVIDQSRDATQAAFRASLAETKAMPRGAMVKFWGLVVLGLVVAVGIPYGASALFFAGRPAGGGGGDLVNLFSRPRQSAPGPPAGPASASGRKEDSERDAIVKSFTEAVRPAGTAKGPGEDLRNEAVRILKEDLRTLGSGADPKDLPLLTKILRSDEAELRAAAADAMGMIKPTAAWTPGLLKALNDPVPAVRGAARRALGASPDQSARLVVERARREQGTGMVPEPVPDSRALGAPVYPGATFLFFASDLGAGKGAFETAEPFAKVVGFYGTAGKRPAMGPREFAQAYSSPRGEPPPAGRAKLQEIQARLLRASQELVAAFQRAGQAGKSSDTTPEIKAKEAEIRDLQAELRKVGDEVHKEELERMTGELVAAEYENQQLIGSPIFVVLEETMSGIGRRPSRFVVVFEDRALQRTGFVLHVPPAASAIPAGAPKKP